MGSWFFYEYFLKFIHEGRDIVLKLNTLADKFVTPFDVFIVCGPERHRFIDCLMKTGESNLLDPFHVCSPLLPRIKLVPCTTQIINATTFNSIELHRAVKDARKRAPVIVTCDDSNLGIEECTLVYAGGDECTNIYATLLVVRASRLADFKQNSPFYSAYETVSVV